MPCFHPTQRNERNVRIDAASILAFWPLRRLRQLRLLRTFPASRQLRQKVRKDTFAQCHSVS